MSGNVTALNLTNPSTQNIKKTVHFETLGCKLNQVESEGAAKVFFDSGFSVDFESIAASSDEKKDICLCVVNTCTVTAKAEQKARRLIRLLLEKCPTAAIIVTGCYAEVSRDEILKIDERICVLGGKSKAALAKIPSIISDIPSNKILPALKEFSANYSEERVSAAEPFSLSTSSFLNHSRASLKIQDGCNAQCTYCKIRIARGKSVSLEAEKAVERVKILEKEGYAEVVLTTVNISQYSSQIVAEDGRIEKIRFARLLKMMLDSTSKIGIRISSLYPEIVDEEFAKIAENPRVRPHFHISVQSGSDAILQKMKRPYKAEAIFRAVSLLRKAKENPFLACDVIAGFPGETDEDFALTMKMLEECNFTAVHAFPFSARPGTEAFSMRPMVPNSVSKKRVAILENFSEKSTRRYIAQNEGKIIPAVSENIRNAKVFADRILVHAVTENFLHCQILLPKNQQPPKQGTLLNVKIIRALDKNEKTGESDTKAEIV